ncbi:hypothetical protein BGZ76_003887 [Entomortierella beljakovae]|nr:hypothetical protein BGZ76_003887 [Entomortierella beljakovae]
MIYIPHVSYMAVAAGAFFVQFTSALVYGPLFGKYWLIAMIKDKNGDHWMNKGADCKDMRRDIAPLIFGELALNIIRAWTTGLLLNLTQARSISQAAQLGAFLYFGAVFPSVTSEVLWEKRGLDLQRFKYFTGLTSTIVMACIMQSIGTD